MSQQTLEEFWARVESDQDLANELDALFIETGGGNAAPGSAVVELAKSRGFEIEESELMAHLAADGESADELSEAELTAIAGGFKIQNVSSFNKVFPVGASGVPGMSSRFILF